MMLVPSLAASALMYPLHSSVELLSRAQLMS